VAQFLPQRWKRQPQGPTQVDWGNPLTNKLGFAALPSNGFLRPREIVTGLSPALSSSTGLTVDAAPFGLALSNTGATTGIVYPTAIKPVNGAASVTLELLIWIPAAGHNNSAIIDQWTSDASWQFGGRNTTGIFFAWGNGTARGAYDSGQNLTTERWNHVAFVWASDGISVTDRLEFWINGVNVGSALWFGGIWHPMYNGTDPITIFNGGGFRGKIGFIRLWSRALQQSEVCTLSENPWQLFRAPRPIIYSFQSGAVVPTLSAATVIDIGTTSVRPRVTFTI